MARKKEVETTEELDNSADPRVYELAFHLDPELSESEAKKAYETLRDVAAKGGTIVAEGEPEKVQLAYTVSRSETTGRRDFDAAYFCWFAYEADGEGHDSVAEAARAEKRIVRFLDIKTTKEEAIHSAQMREMRDKASVAPVEEAVSDTELDAAIEAAQ